MQEENRSLCQRFSAEKNEERDNETDNDIHNGAEQLDYRRQKAYDNLNEAKEVAKLHFWNLTGNRLYYATFHMASALLLDKGMSAKSHGGLIHLIGSQFVTKGLLYKS